MANISVGSVSVRVVPDATDFAKDLRAKLVPIGNTVGAEIGKAIAAGITKGIGDPLSGPLRDLPTKNKPQTEKDGESLGGAFADGFSKRLRAAFQALPKAKIDADSSDADRKLAELRTRMEELSTKTIGVDIDSGDALAKIAAIKTELDDLAKTSNLQVSADTAAAAAELAAIGAEAERIAAEHPTVQVDADTARAIAELAAVDEEASRLDRLRARVSVDADTSGALAGIQTIGYALAGLAAIPAIAPLAAGIGGLVPALGAAGAGFGGLAAVALPALSQIKTALQDQTKAQQNSAAAGVQAQQHALALAGAQQQLAQAVQNEAYAHQQAVQQVVAAEQQLAQAQVSAREAQISLSEARAAEVQRLQDLKNSLADANLSIDQDKINVDRARLALQQLTSAQADAQRVAQAQAGVRQAQASQQAIGSTPGATQGQKDAAAQATANAQAALKAAQQQQQQNDLARRQAQLAYQQAIQQLKEEQLAYQRLQQQQATANKQGVEGADQVRKAREALAAANQREQASEQALAQARQNVYRSDQQAAGQVTAAQRALHQAQLQSASGNTALASSMAALSPAARTLMTEWQGLSREFSAWSRSLQPAVLPLFGRGIALVRDMLPTLTPVVRGAAGAVNGLITDVGVAARSPFWTQFRQSLTNLVPTAITGLGRSAGNVATGLAGIVNAFLPYAPAILSFITRITGQFANWGKGLASSGGFKQFIDYARQNLPLVERTVGTLVTSIGHVVSALAPLGPSVLGGFGLLLRIVGGLKPGEIQAIAIAIGVIVAAVKAWRIAQLALDFALDANPIALVIIGITALVAAVIFAYNHFTWFRTIVNGAWTGIKTAALFAWNLVLKPVFTALKVAVQAVGTVIMWLWRNVIAPGFTAIMTIGKVLAAVLLFAVFLPLYGAFKLLEAVVLYFWHNTVVPAWIGIRTAILFAWNNVIKPVFNAIVGFLNATLGPVFRWLWHNVISPVWNGIKAVISGVWNDGIKPVFNAVKSAIGSVGTAFAAGANAIRYAWDKIRDYTKGPINFVIGTVYDQGVVGLWNKVMGWLHLPGSLQLNKVPLLESGGELSAAQPIQPMITNGPMAIVGEGRSQYPEYVIPTDPKYRGRAQGLWAAAGGDLQMLASGGVLGDVLGTVKKVAGSVVNLGKDALNLITDPKKVWDGLVKKMVPSAAGLATSPWGKAAAAIPPELLGEVWTAAKSIIDTFSSAFGGAGGQAMVSLALSQVGYHEGPGNSNKYSAGLGRPAEAWCADFVDWLGKQTGQSKALPQTASAPGMARGFGSRFVSGSSGIQAGDIVFFDEGQGSIVHTGIAVTANKGGSWTSVEGNYGDQVAKNTRSSAAGHAHPAYSGGGVGSFPGGSLVHASPSAAQAWARQALVGHGWSGQAGDLISLWNRESGWRWNATNPTSGAYGIPQSLPASKMGSAGSDWRDNAATQIKWGLGYIQGRYGSPARAWSHELSAGWYDEGGMLPVGPSLVFNGTGAPEPVFTGSQFEALVNGQSGGSTEYHAHFDGWTAGALEGRVRGAFHAMEISNGNRERVGRRH